MLHACYVIAGVLRVEGNWTDISMGASVQYDPFGDGVDKNAWADTYTTTSTNPLWKMTGF